MKLLKTGFSRIHAVVMLAALVNITLGAGMALGIVPYVPFGEIHGFAGVSVLPLLLLLPLLSPKRKNLYAALKAKLLITKRDLAQHRPFAIAAKVVTQLLALAFLLQLITGGLIETGLAYQLFPDFGMLSFHMTFLYVLPTLLLLHVIFMLLAGRKPSAARR